MHIFFTTRNFLPVMFVTACTIALSYSFTTKAEVVSMDESFKDYTYCLNSNARRHIFESPAYLRACYFGDVQNDVFNNVFNACLERKLNEASEAISKDISLGLITQRVGEIEKVVEKNIEDFLNALLVKCGKNGTIRISDKGKNVSVQSNQGELRLTH